jgi:hypothetical protein
MDTTAHDFRSTFKGLDDDALIDPDEFASLMKLNKQGIYHRLHIHELVEPAVRRNKQVRWRVSDVRTYLKNLNEIRDPKGEGKRVGRPRKGGVVT